MKRTILAAAIGLTATTASAEEWIDIQSSTGGWQYHARANSFHMNPEKGGAMMLVRTRQPDGTVTFSYRIVRMSDCEQGMGEIGTFSVSGQFLYRNDFVLGGGNIASGFADVLCALVKRANAQTSY